MRVHKRELFPTSFGSEPWLIQLHGKKNDEQEFMNPYNHCIKKRKIPRLKGKLCLGSFEDWLLLADEITKATYFLHHTLDPKLKVRLPPLRGKSFNQLGGCVLSSSPTSRKCVVTFVEKRSNVILYCRPKDAKWTEVPLPIKADQYRFNGQVVRIKGSIYARCCCKVVVINEDSLLTADCSWTIIDMPARTEGCVWRHLVASGEEIFLVSIAICMYQGIPTNYTVHRLESSGISWKRVESIGGRAFFLGGIQSSALSATQAGTQRDCIFVVNLNYYNYPGRGIYRICLRNQTVNLSLLLKRRDKIWNKLCWAMPTSRSMTSRRKTLSLSHSIRTNKCDAICVDKEKKKEKDGIDISRSWADMPTELLQLLLRQLCLVDCLRLSSVCKAWNSFPNPIQEAKVHPWLVYTIKGSSSWRLFDPVCGKEYSIDMTWLGFSSDLTFHYSKDGWVLVSKEDNSLFLLNPLTRKSVSLPYLDTYKRSNLLGFSAAPTSLDCVVFTAKIVTFSVIEISTWSPGEEKWSTRIFHDEYDLVVPCSPVFYRGEFYCYGHQGALLVFDPKEKTHRVLETQAPIEFVLYRRRIMECYLVESSGDLFTVFKGCTTNSIRVFKLDQLNMVWCELDGMRDIRIFLNRKTSLAKPCPERCGSQIYLSGFTDDHCKSSAFYSLETMKYYPEIYYLLQEHTNCIWIEPNLPNY